MRIAVSIFLFLSLISCKTVEIASLSDYYPSQCSGYEKINIVLEKERNYFSENGLLKPIRDYNYYVNSKSGESSLVEKDVYRFIDQKSVQMFEFSEKTYGYDIISYMDRFPNKYLFGNDFKNYKKSYFTQYRCDLSKDLKVSLDNFFKDKQCSVDGIYKKHPDENIMILEKMDSEGVYSFKFIYRKEDKEAIYKILTETWQKVYVPESGCLPWECIKNKKVFPYDPFKELREK